MHPIERLRYVARASGAAQRSLVRETAAALAAFTSDHQALVTACRRVVSRQPWAGSLVWYCARVLSAGDPDDEVWDAAGLIQADATASVAARELPDDATVVVLGWPEVLAEALARRGDLRVLVVDVLDEGASLADQLQARDIDAVDVPVWGLGRAVAAADLLVIEAIAAGPDAVLAPAGSLAAAAVARTVDVPVWVAAPLGRTLPAPMFDEVVARTIGDGEPDCELERVPVALLDDGLSADGRAEIAQILARPECPTVPELFRGDVI